MSERYTGGGSLKWPHTPGFGGELNGQIEATARRYLAGSGERPPDVRRKP